MTRTYIQFDTPEIDRQKSTDGLIKSSLKKALLGFLTAIIPKANPDFEDKIDEVQNWLIECDNETGIPKREIGLDKEGRVILKMPFKSNYGYWTDNHLLLKDFYELFKATEISKEIFDWKWEMFDKLSDFETEITDYKILTTGSDGGHIYITTEINYKGKQRTLVVYFADKSDEQKINTKNKLHLKGRLLDEGEIQSLSLLDTKLID
jgi:hypothetical protein